MATSYDNLNNPQQNPGYQQQQNPGYLSYQNYQQGGWSGAGGPRETFMQRLNRSQMGGSQRYGGWNQTQNPGAAPNLQQPSSQQSPVTSTGHLSQTPAQPAPSLLGSGQFAQYGVDPNANTGTGPGSWDAANNRYNTTQPGTYLYHGDVGGGNIGWYAAAQPYNANGAQGPGASTPSAPTADQYFAQQGLPQLPPNSTYYADSLGNSPFQAYGGFQFNNAALPMYQQGRFNVALPQQYVAGQLSQFNPTNTSAIGGDTAGLVQHVLENPLSLSPQVVQQMQEQQKETLLQAQKQGMEQSAQLAAQRGLAPTSGQLAADQLRQQQAFQSGLTSSYRDIAIQKAMQDQQDRLAAAGLGNDYLTSQLGRDINSYQTTLAGQQAQEGLKQAQAQSGLANSAFQADLQQRQMDEAFRQYQSQAAQRQFGFGVEQAQAGQDLASAQSQQAAQQLALQRAISQSGINQQAANSGLANYQTMLNALQQQRQYGLGNRQLDIQQQLGQAGIGVDYAKLAESGRQFDASNKLDYLRYLLEQQQVENQASQFGDTLGFDYANLNSNNFFNGLRFAQQNPSNF